ncbi:SMC5-SMC6 complex localization factor protein 2 isoform X2 [Sarcophilus harrisii]|uniref:SMC5-SMC6 complex localization factor protein 2 isoform X2 n=1 Tax=Sarcophilus harrisii TaxID=9305 RepID=UPI001301F59A|nr:SMC5-SMC6 complex localization factor protein 2 isoform X2 [Sarcophilus harrisii]
MKLGGEPARPSPNSSPARARRCLSRPNAAQAGSGRCEESPADRNQSITDFFKPVPKQDKLELNSSQSTNYKCERDRLLHTDIRQFERKISSPKNLCMKMPRTPPNKNSIAETLMRGLKEKKGKRDVPEGNGPFLVQKTLSLVVEKPIISTSHHCLSRNKRKDPRKQESSPIKMSSRHRENMREKANKCTDQNKTITDAKSLVSSTEPEILESNSSKIGGRNDIPRCQQSECSVEVQQEPENEDCLRKRLHSNSLDTSGADSSGVSNAKTCIISSSKKERVVNLPKAPVSLRIKKRRKRNFKDVTNTSSVKTSSKSWPFQTSSITKGSSAVLEGDILCSPNIPRLAHENLENSSSTSSFPGKKQKVDFDSDEESLDCSLESEEEEEEDVVLKPLQQLMSLNSSQPASPEKPFVLSENPRALSSDNSVSIRYQCFENPLESMIKENENPPRSEEWEKELKEDIVKGQGIKTQSEIEKSGNTNDSGELQEEHREFIRKFFIALDTIPDYHPGEEIFHFFDFGKIFTQYTLDLRDCNFVPKNAIEDLILKSGKTQQIFLTTQGYLSTAYHYIQCPIPVLKWLFQMMSVHTDCIISIQLLNTLINITIRNDTTSGSSSWPWIPSLFDIATVFINMGVSFKCLFPVQNLQPVFNEDIFNFKVQHLSEERKSEDSIVETVVSCLPETNILNVVKFIGLCTAVYPEGYTDQEIILLLLMFLKMSLEKHLKQIALVDFQSLLINLLKNIRDWDTKMPELCMAISELSTHHHNLLWLVQFVPNWTIRGRQVRQHLSLVIIAKFLDKKPEHIPSTSELQMSLLCQYLMQMKPSDLLRKMVAKKRSEEEGNITKNCLTIDLEQQVYYLTYVLLHLVNEVSAYSFPFQRRKYLLKLCGSLEKHIKCYIKEDARFFHRTKVVDLVAIIQGKWQDMIHNSQPIQKI